MAIQPFHGISPCVDSSSFIAPDAWVIGDCDIGSSVSIFFGAVLRGDIKKISVGTGTNIQEHALLHTSYEFGPVVIGNNVTVGHRAIIHGAVVGDECLIGMGATLLDNCAIGTHCIIGAHTLVPKGMVIPPRSLIVGTPAKIIREVSDDEIAGIRSSAERYQVLGKHYVEALLSLKAR